MKAPPPARLLTPALVLVAAGLPGGTVLGFPICTSETGERVRAGIFGAGFETTLLTTSLPFVVLAGVVATLHFGVPFLPRRASGRIGASSLSGLPGGVRR